LAWRRSAAPAWPGCWRAWATTDFGRQLAWGPYVAAAAVGWALFAALGMLALLVAATQTRAGSAAGLGSAAVLGGFVLDLLPWTGDAPLALINPWHWYDPPGIVSAGVRWGELAALAGLGGMALGATLLVWRAQTVDLGVGKRGSIKGEKLFGVFHPGPVATSADRETTP
jgi:hypothetical protein